MSGTYAAPDPTGRIVRQSGRQVPADAIDKINKGFDIKPDAKPAPTIKSKPSNTKDAPVRTGQNSFDLGGGASLEF